MKEEIQEWCKINRNVKEKLLSDKVYVSCIFHKKQNMATYSFQIGIDICSLLNINNGSRIDVFHHPKNHNLIKIKLSTSINGYKIRQQSSGSNVLHFKFTAPSIINPYYFKTKEMKFELLTEPSIIIDLSS